jgi:hypothetical protein
MTALNNVTTADGYTAASTLHAANSTRLMIHARNAAVFYELGQGVGGVVWLGEVFLPPGTLGADRQFDAVRVRSALAGKPAQITIDAGGAF